MEKQARNKPKTQVQIVDDFLAGATEGVNGINGNLKIVGNQLIHYQTVIAERDQKRIILNHTRYSIVTGRIQKELKEKLQGKEYISIGKIPEGFRGSLVEKVEVKEVPENVR